MTPQAPDDISDIAELIHGVWMPKGEKHLTEWMLHSKGKHIEHGIMTYQWKKQQAALALVQRFRPNYAEEAFIDIGAHVGLWSMWWVRVMGQVLAYEPIPQFQRIWRKNVEGNRSPLRPDVPVVLSPFALGKGPASISMVVDPANTGDTHISTYEETRNPETRAGLIHVYQESLFFDAPKHLRGRKVAVVKIDCEGWELPVVEGGAELFDKERPIIVVEQKRSTRYKMDPVGAVDFLVKRCTYVQHQEISGDFFMIPKELL